MATGRSAEIVAQLNGQPEPLLVISRTRSVGFRQVEQGRIRRPVEVCAPEGLRFDRVAMFRDPLDVTPVGLDRGQDGSAGFDAGAIERRDFLEENLNRPAVEKDMVERPDCCVFALAKTEHHQPERRRISEIEPAIPIFVAPCGQPRCARRSRRIPPVFRHKGKLHVAPHDLNRLVEVVPHERGAQNRVAIEGELPRLPHRVDIEVAIEGSRELLDVRAVLRFECRVEQQAFLQRRQPIDVFEIRVRRAEPIHPFLIERYEREVRRRCTSAGGCGGSRDQLLEPSEEVCGQHARRSLADARADSIASSS